MRKIWRKDYGMLKDEFRHPGREHRSVPFWAWNGEMREEEIVRQIREMAAQGVGGFFMHSREGLETPYMEEKWLSCIRTAVREAGKNHMTAWLYDEDRWPSGTAGGRVTAQGDRYRLKGLTLEICGTDRPVTAALTEERNAGNPDLPEGGLLLAVYAARIRGMEILSFRRLESQNQDAAGEGTLREGEVFLAARLECSAGSEWFNKETPPDNLNPDTVSCFLNMTHELYYQTVGEYFGTVVRGVFTDEPSLADRHAAFPANRGWIPWTLGFEDYYKERRGRDVFDTLPYLYFNGEGSRKARYDYWNTVSDRFAEAYSKTISEWCRKHHIAFTGHFLQEDKLGLCARVNGSIMPHYKYQDIPGIDMLGEEAREYLTVKQCTSVAHQFGKKEVLTETYGCTGWDFTFEGMKWVGDWQYVLGVNMRCQHLALYSLKGLRKRDYPPCFNYNTSWWEKNHVVEDYFARLGAVLKAGEPVRKLLVIHPMGTAWSRLGASPYGNPVRRLERDVPAINQYGNSFNRLLEELSRQHLDYDLGDETLIESDGYVKGAAFGIGMAEYEAVLIPPMDTLRRNTIHLLRQFADQGGRIVWMEPKPYLIEGEADTQGSLERLFGHERSRGCRTIKEAAELLEKYGIRTVDITDPGGYQIRDILALHKRTSEEEIVFVVNHDRKQAHRFLMKLPGLSREDTAEEWNPADGSVREAAWEQTQEGPALGRELKACESVIYRIVRTEGNPSEQAPCKPEQNRREGHSESGRRIAVCGDTAQVTLTHPNVFVLDRCRWRFADAGREEEERDRENTGGMSRAGEWSEETEIWQAQRRIRELLGMRENNTTELIQRYRWVHTPEAKRGRRISLRMSVIMEELPQGPVFLAAEEAGELDIYVNGVKQNGEVQGWYLDKSFEKRPVGGFVRGYNEIIIEMLYQERSELEMYYLLGSFSVFRGEGRERMIRGPVRSLSLGDWTLQGLLHYAGSVRYQYTLTVPESARQDGGDYLLRIGAFEAVCVTVRLNGSQFEVPWKACGDIRIPGELIQERNRLEIEVYASPRNMLGPFHLAGEKPRITNSGGFQATDENYTESYRTVPYGLIGPAELCTI